MPLATLRLLPSNPTGAPANEIHIGIVVHILARGNLPTSRILQEYFRLETGLRSTDLGLIDRPFQRIFLLDRGVPWPRTGTLKIKIHMVDRPGFAVKNSKYSGSSLYNVKMILVGEPTGGNHLKAPLVSRRLLAQTLDPSEPWRSPGVRPSLASMKESAMRMNSAFAFRSSWGGRRRAPGRNVRE